MRRLHEHRLFGRELLGYGLGHRSIPSSRRNEMRLSIEGHRQRSGGHHPRADFIPGNASGCHPAGVMVTEWPRTTIVGMASNDVASAHVQVPGQREPAPSGMWRLIELEPPGGREFDDAQYEWRRLFSELLGTFLLVVAGAGGAVAHTPRGRQTITGRA